MVKQKYIVVFDPKTRKQIKYGEYKGEEDLQLNWPSENIRLVEFNAICNECFLDESGNIIITPKVSSVPSLSSKIEHDDIVLAVQCCVSYLIKSRLIDLSKREQSVDDIIKTVQTNLDFEIDDSLNSLLERVKVVKDHNFLTS